MDGEVGGGGATASPVELKKECGVGCWRREGRNLEANLEHRREK